MQRTLLKILASEARTLFRPEDGHEKVEVYYDAQSGWHDLDARKVDDTTVIAHLKTTKQTPARHWRGKSSRRSYYYFPETDSVLCLDSRQGPTANTRERFLEKLQGSARHARALYDAQYDDLTGLWNRKTFQQFASANLPTATSTMEIAQVELQPYIWLLAVDIDHFKQLNDSYGHAYGDVVLHCFARRLLSIVNAFQSADTIACCGRLGGEEFGVLVAGAVSRERISQLAVTISQVAGSAGLPAPAEWLTEAERLGCVGMGLPSLTARSVTASVGITGLAPSQIETPAVALAILARQADQALYRAKSGGRNTHRFFSDIRNSLGVVLERHTVTDVVCIDIGKWVDVRVGNEFLVFDPEFRGGVPFEVFDGRSTRVMGSRPRLHCGRLAVIDVQEEISFCRIASELPIGSIRKNQVLEYVPLGSIAHLLPGNHDVAQTNALATIRQSLARSVVDKDHVAVVALCIADPVAVEKQHGIAVTNATLAEIHKAMAAALGHSVELARLSDATYVGLAKSRSRFENMPSTVESILDTIRKHTDPSIRLCAGLCVPPEPTKTPESTDPWASYLAIENSADYATIAMEVARRRGDRLVAYATNSPEALLYESRRRQKYEVAARDYETMRQLGIRSHAAENQIALCYLHLGKLDLAVAAMRNAFALGGTAPVYYANLGLILHEAGDINEAAEVFEKALATGYVMPLNYLYEAGRSLLITGRTISRESQIQLGSALLERLIEDPKGSEGEKRSARELLSHSPSASSSQPLNTSS